jgi:hypothetical protein
MANRDLQLLTDAAKLLRPILGELVFMTARGNDQNARASTDQSRVPRSMTNATKK